MADLVSGGNITRRGFWRSGAGAKTVGLMFVLGVAISAILTVIASEVNGASHLSFATFSTAFLWFEGVSFTIFFVGLWRLRFSSRRAPILGSSSTHVSRPPVQPRQGGVWRRDKTGKIVNVPAKR